MLFYLFLALALIRLLNEKRMACLILFYSWQAFAEHRQECSYFWPLFKPLCFRFNQILREGESDLYITGYAWHNRYVYPPEKIAMYNEAAWGGGYGKSLFDEKAIGIPYMLLLFLILMQM